MLLLFTLYDLGDKKNKKKNKYRTDVTLQQLTIILLSQTSLPDIGAGTLGAALNQSLHAWPAPTPDSGYWVLDLWAMPCHAILAERKHFTFHFSLVLASVTMAIQIFVRVFRVIPGVKWKGWEEGEKLPSGPSCGGTVERPRVSALK